MAKTKIVSVPKHKNPPQPPPRQEMIVTTPDQMLATAVNAGRDLEYIKQLMDLQNRWQEKKAKAAFFAAMAKFQSIVPDMTKNRQVSFDHKDKPGKTEYKFQDIGNIAKHIRGPLSECGLSYSWITKEDGDKIIVACVVSHADGYEKVGESLSGEADKSGGKNGIQAKSSTISYLERITLRAALGLSSSEEDDDGQGGAKSNSQETYIIRGLPAITEQQLQNAVRGILNGSMTIENLKENFTFTEAQLTTIEITARNKK